MPDGYDHDPEKDLKNQGKGRPALEEAITVLEDPGIHIYDWEHKGVPQFRAIGRTERGSLVTLVLELNEHRRRICTWWPSSRQERRTYELAQRKDSDS